MTIPIIRRCFSKSIELDTLPPPKIFFALFFHTIESPKIVFDAKLHTWGLYSISVGVDVAEIGCGKINFAPFQRAWALPLPNKNCIQSREHHTSFSYPEDSNSSTTIPSINTNESASAVTHLWVKNNTGCCESKKVLCWC